MHDADSSHIAGGDIWQAAHEEQTRRVRQLETELQIVYSSKSWRLTAPMRAARKALDRMIACTWMVSRQSCRVLWAQAQHLSRRSARYARALARRLPQPVRRLLRTVIRRPVPPRQQPDFDCLTLAPLPANTVAVAGQKGLRRGEPLVSVVIPCFNYGHFLEEAVDSVLRQTLSSVEIIVVDDGSTDEATLSVLATFVKPRTVVLRRPNGGLSSARNQGVRAARGRYVCCLDADDRLAPTYLEKATAILESDHGAGFAYSWVKLFGDDDDIWHTDRFDLAELRRRNFIPVSAVFRIADWATVGGYAEDMRNGYEDWEFWLRLASLGRRGVLIPEALFEHRLHGRTMIFSAREQHEALVQTIRERHRSLYDDDNLVARLQASYAVRPIDPPFVNLEHCSYENSSSDSEVLALVPWLPAGGAEAVLHAIISGLATPAAPVTIVTSEPSRNEWHARFERLTPRIYHLPAFLPRSQWADFVHYLIRSRPIGSVLVSGSTFGYELLPVLKCRYPGIRRIELLHNASPLGHISKSIRYTDAIDVHVVVARTIAEALIESDVEPSKIKVIGNGVDTDRFDPALYSREEVRRHWGLARHTPTIAYIGRLDEIKSPLSFLDLAASLADLNVQFVLVGDGPLRHLVLERLKANDVRGRVRWLQAVEPDLIPSVLATADALAITSSVEGLPIVMLEALAMQVPVFSYDVGAVRSVVDSNINGFVAERNDLAALSGALRHFVTSPASRQRLKANARASVIRGGFTLERAQQAYSSVLQAPAGVLSLTPEELLVQVR